MDFLFLFILIIWFGGTCWRIYRQARFYQIEEYMSIRYLRWCAAKRERWLPKRLTLAWVGGMVVGFVLAEAPGSILLTIIGVVSAVIGIWPPSEGEIKKSFRSTARAKRLLGGAYLTAFITLVVLTLILTRIHWTEMGIVRFAGYSLSGLFLFLSAPLFLVVGNIIMTPLEAMFRRRFIGRARKALEAVHPTVIGITGSYGKTSTKTFVAHLLNGRYRAYPTPKSYNTLMGVCLAINNDLAGDHSIDYFICEMGAYIPGEIREIADLTHPTISVVVEIGPQHLERFGSVENIAKAKYEIIKALPSDGLGVFNWDNPYVREMYERGYPENRIAVSKEIDPKGVPAGGPRLVASEVSETLDGLHFTVTDTKTGETERFETSLLGEHNVMNVLLATAIVIHEGMSLRDAARRARTLQPAESRLVRKMTPGGITIINDAYSANPAGVVSSLRTLALHETGRRLLITPGMVELGAMMEQENHRLGEIAAEHATDVILVGAQQTEPIKAGLLGAGFPAEHLQVMDTLAESVAWYQANLTAGDTVLFLNDLPDTYS